MSENRYPAYSLGQAIERLSPKARRKLDDLKGSLADSEALQRALMERIRVKEEHIARLGYQRSYTSDPAEQARFDAELVSLHADLDKLERERSKRNSIRSSVAQTVGRIENFIGEIFSGASDISRPQWPDSVPGLRDGETLTDGILRLRSEIAEFRAQLVAVQTAPPLASEVKAALIAEIDRMAAAGAPHISIAAGKVKITWPDQMPFGAPGAALSAPAGSVGALLAWKDPDGLKARLLADVKDSPGAISATERPRLIREAEARIFALEVAEERLVMAALDAGEEVHRRPDASAWAVLYTDTEAVRAEAAE